METRSIKHGLKFLLVFCCILVMQVLPVQAAEQIAETAIGVEQIFKTEYSVPANLNRSFSYQLKALDEENPMPEGSRDGVYRFQLKDSRKTQIGPIQYEHGGLYEYELRQEVGEKEKGYTYDETIYRVKVYVRNTRDGRLACQLVMENEKGEKTDGAVFRNSYQGSQPKSPSAVKTGDTQTPFFWILILAVTLLIIAVTAGTVIRRRRKDKVGL